MAPKSVCRQGSLFCKAKAQNLAIRQKVAISAASSDHLQFPRRIPMITDPASAIKRDVLHLIDLQIETLRQDSSLNSSELVQKEEKATQARITNLSRVLEECARSLQFFEKRGIAAVDMRQPEIREKILNFWKQSFPEVWSQPDAKPMIDLLFAA
jgi:hypothetical protein